MLGCVWTLPRIAFAQTSGRTYRLGWLIGGAAAIRSEPYTIAFVDRLRELGFVEGRNLVIELRSAMGKREQLPKLAGELGGLNCDVLLVAGTEASLIALKEQTRDTPIDLPARSSETPLRGSRHDADVATCAPGALRARRGG